VVRRSVNIDIRFVVDILWLGAGHYIDGIVVEKLNVCRQGQS
jgi:hypothetical protein